MVQHFLSHMLHLLESCHNLGLMSLVKKTKTLLWQYNFKRKIGGLEKIYSTYVWSKQKKEIKFFIFIYCIWTSSGFYTLKKNLKPVTTLRRLVGNRGSFSHMNLKYHVSIPMQGLYSDSIMCLVMKPLASPLVEWLLSYVVY